MLEIIAVDSLIPGMFLYRISGNWLKHSFWKRSFVLDANDIKILSDSGVCTVIIDLDRGLLKPDEAQQELLNRESVTPKKDVHSSAVGDKIKTTKSVAAEIEYAKHLVASASSQMKAIFQQIRVDGSFSPKILVPIVNAISASVIRSPHALTSIVRLKQHDTYTYMHSVAVCALMMGLAAELELDEETARMAGTGGLMHDIGKALMPLDVLNKPGGLTDEEFRIAKNHPRDGWNLLQSGELDSNVLDIVLHHHEKIDGTGYPNGLKVDEISSLARMGAVCDVYDAVTSDRPYKTAWPPAVALSAMMAWEGHFDQKILKAFVRYMGVYPVGSLVRLKSGYLAVVLDQNRDDEFCPLVKKFFNLISNQPIFPQILNLAKARSIDQIMQAENPRKWNFPRLNDLWINYVK